MSKHVPSRKKDSLRRFLVKVNRDTAFRKRFLENPVAVLKIEGISLSPEAAEEVKEITTEFLRILPELAEVPKGYDSLLDAIAGKEELAGKERLHLPEPPMIL